MRNKVPAYSAVGATVAFLGLYLLTNYNYQGLSAGDILTFICTIFCVAHLLAIDKYAKQYKLVPLALSQFFVMALIAGIFALSRGAMTLEISTLGWSVIIFLGIFATAIAFVIQILAQRVIEPTRAGLIFAMEAPFGTFFGWMLGGETFTQIALFGALLMVCGMFISEGKQLAYFLRNKFSQ